MFACQTDLPFPGVDHTAKSASGYAYVPLTHAEHY
jgi:hypothetical protein